MYLSANSMKSATVSVLMIHGPFNDQNFKTIHWEKCNLFFVKKETNL